MKKVIIKGFPIVKGEVRDGAIIEIPVPVWFAWQASASVSCQVHLHAHANKIVTI